MDYRRFRMKAKSRRLHEMQANSCLPRSPVVNSEDEGMLSIQRQSQNAHKELIAEALEGSPKPYYKCVQPKAVP